MIAAGGEPQSEVAGDVEAVTGREQDAALGGSLAEGTRVLAAGQPRERRHAALWSNPAEQVAMLGHEAVQALEIARFGLLGFAEDHIAFADVDLGQNLSRIAVSDRKVGSRIPILLLSDRVVFDHPAGAQSRKRKSFGEVADHRGVRQAGC